jgi:hypothetical protein
MDAFGTGGYYGSPRALAHNSGSFATGR